MARYARGEDAAFTDVFAAVAPEIQALALRELRDPMLAVQSLRAALGDGKPESTESRP